MSEVRNNLYEGKYDNTLPWGKDTETREAYRAESRRLHDLFKEDVEREEGVQNNPKKDKLFEIAWDMGHSSGYSEVYNYYIDLVELIK